MIAKCGPFANSNCCAGVRGVLDRLITHFLVLLLVMHVWLELEEGWLGAPVGAVGAIAVLVEGVEAVGVAEVVGLPLALDKVLEILDGIFRCLLKEHQLVSMLSKFGEPPEQLLLTFILWLLLHV